MSSTSTLAVSILKATVDGEKDLEGVLRAERDWMKAVLAEKSACMVASVESALSLCRGLESDAGTS